MNKLRWEYVLGATLVFALIGCGRSPEAPVLDEGRLATLVDNVGDYSHPVSGCEGTAQDFFDQGLRLYYGFYFPESLASFRESARLAPDCPMAHWGVALAISPNPNSRYHGLPDDPKGEGAKAIEHAVAMTDQATQKERELIEALRLRYDAGTQPEQAQRDRAYSDAMRVLAERYPDDPEAGTLYAESLMTLSPWVYWSPDGAPLPGTEAAKGSLENVVAQRPEHPGANHFYVHLMEDSQDPELALPHAERLAQTMPGEGHIVHMPSHIYIRTGRYEDAVKSNQQSLAADEAFLAAWGDVPIELDAVPAPMSAKTHGPHAQDFLHMAAVLRGNYAEAIGSARDVAAPLENQEITGNGRAQRQLVRQWFTMKRFGKWEEILSVPEPEGDMPFVEGIWHYARGSALTATGRLAEAEADLASVRVAASSEDIHGLNTVVNPAEDLLTITGYILDADIAEKRGELDRAISLLETAVRLEDGLKYMEPPDWNEPVRELLGAALLEAGRPKEAEVVYWEDLRRNPDNGWSLHGVWQGLLQQGEDAMAAEAERRFQQAWAGADVTLTASRF